MSHLKYKHRWLWQVGTVAYYRTPLGLSHISGQWRLQSALFSVHWLPNGSQSFSLFTCCHCERLVKWSFVSPGISSVCVHMCVCACGSMCIRHCLWTVLYVCDHSFIYAHQLCASAQVCACLCKCVCMSASDVGYLRVCPSVHLCAFVSMRLIVAVFVLRLSLTMCVCLCLSVCVGLYVHLCPWICPMYSCVCQSIRATSCIWVYLYVSDYVCFSAFL